MTIKRIMKKGLSLTLCLVLSLVLLAGFAPLTAHAAATSGSCGDNATWSYDADTAVLTISGKGAMYDYTNGGTPWDSYCADIMEISISDSITSIGNFAFSDCENVSEITIPNGVTSIGERAFDSCSALRTVILSDNLRSVAMNMFYGCSYIEYNTYEDTNYLGSSSNPYLLLVDAPNSASGQAVIHPDTKLIGCSAFELCTKITGVDIPDGVTLIAYGAFASCNKLEEVIIPDSVTCIDSYAFQNCESLTSITFPASVTRLSSNVCDGCESLSTVIIPDSVTSIEDAAFSGCIALTKITIPDGVTSIGGYVFEECTNLTKVIIPDGVTNIGDSTFEGCTALTSVSLPSGITRIGSDAFSGCTSLASITLPSGVTGIGDYAFSECTGLTNISIPNSVTTIGEYAFYRCSGLESVKLPSKLTSLETAVFRDCSELTTITIPGAVTSVGVRAFYNCSNLNNIEIPASVTSIGQYAFDGCGSLTTVYYSGTEAQWDAIKVDKYNTPLTNAKVEYVVRKTGVPVITLSNIASTGKIKISWDEVDNAESYQVYRSTDNETWKHLKTIEDTSLTNTSATAGTKYYYKVRAVAADGTKSAYSDVKSITCDLPRPVVKATNVTSTGKIKLTWDAIDGATKYEVYYADYNGGEFTKLSTTTKTSITHTSIGIAETGYYKVRAICSNSAANSAYSAVVSRMCKLAQPVITVSNQSSSGKPRITWDGIKESEKYKLFIYDAEGNFLKSVSTSKIGITHSSAVAGETYKYKVRAYITSMESKADAVSAYSAVKSGTCDLARPTVKVSNVASTGKIKVTWDAVEDADRYKVYIYDADGELQKTSSTTKTSLTHSSAVTGETYTYKVRAYMDESSNATSDYSPAKDRTCDLPRPKATVALNSSGKPKLTWNAVDGAAKYKIYIYDANGEQLKTSTTAKTSLTHSSAVTGETYTYKVVAIHTVSTANSAASAAVTIVSE